ETLADTLAPCTTRLLQAFVGGTGQARHGERLAQRLADSHGDVAVRDVACVGAWAQVDCEVLEGEWECQPDVSQALRVRIKCGAGQVLEMRLCERETERRPNDRGGQR
ncbi:unnamed protein product, partial [Mycena citricolor]